MVVSVGINGFGRIGKGTFLQLLELQEFAICAINTKLSVHSLEKYINTDSVHGNRNHKVEIVDEQNVIIKGRKIRVMNERDPANLPYRALGVEYLFECTGAFLTTEKLSKFDVEYVILSAPPKDMDTTPMYCYGVNDRDYAGAKIISIASCTTNCIAPFLAAAQSIGSIVDGNFITVHAATASQSIVDVAFDKVRTNRSIFNNIIPHTTGASKTIDWLLPELKGKIKGTSIRVPVSNVSMVDLNLKFNAPMDKDAFLEKLKTCKYPHVVDVNHNKGVSSDFIGITSPSIVDYHGAIQLSEDHIKFCLWYDNEWSFCTQMIHMCRTMAEVNAPRRIRSIRDVEFNQKSVFVRVDFNCPQNADGSVADDFRIRAALPTLNSILKDGATKVIIATHFGRPKASEPEFSTKLFLPHLTKFLNREIKFLPSGLETTAEEITEDGVYLMENTRFHDFETKPDKRPDFKLAFPVDVYCNEAFSCSHRAHTSITGIKAPLMCVGHQVLREVLCMDRILGRAGDKVVAVIGGSKMEDKIPMLQSLNQRVDVIFIGGNNVNAIFKDPSLLDQVRGGRAEIVLLEDGFGNTTPSDAPQYADNAGTSSFPLYDAGPVGLNKLAFWVNKADVIFWNGALGITEHPFYKNGSESLLHLLKQCPGDVVIGGGDTAGFVSNYDTDFYHVSTGGGASIDYITKQTLVGITYYD
eukprot:CAMPEP_0114359424 /NCGR_PEP_ID=MMETSP0101-20121206/23005_1 /TAXON_ID=38822 ORGANISM="Pteridomonas danica, Strain PT" /NCGR_SAMPLE_ID=MMETSP0101 /ASSEMBLY_ACC=CAM_ASM_000211 /LENGTH=695 /DNA_ID=CAMNT_0001502957 /DNA_START=72 /DNA_END=2159 /DNA_ORIENTATION=-